MNDPFWGQLVKQNRLEEMYDIFRRRGDMSDKELALHLARFAEARIFTAADIRIIELEDALRKAQREPVGREAV